MYRERAAGGLGELAPAPHWNSTLVPFYCHCCLLTHVRRKPDSPIGGIRFAVHHYTICLKKANQVATVEGDACELQVVFDERCEVGNGGCSCLFRARHALSQCRRTTESIGSMAYGATPSIFAAMRLNNELMS
jgi:hypothetical protein